MPDGDGNLAKLQDAGLIVGSLPEPYAHVVAGLTPHEVDTLVAIKKRLDAADAWHGAEPGKPGALPGFTNFMVF
jgi:hypothetical protein